MVNEFELIRRYFTTAGRTAGVTLGVGDDAALLDLPAGMQLVAAVDTIVAGRHFLASTSAHSIGYRALAVNLSDLAAMGAQPAWATLALTLPQADEHWLQGFSAGLLSLAAQHGVALVGGDTTGGPLTVSVQLLGWLPPGSALRRDGAQAGDLLVVTGTLGDAGAGLKYAREGAQADDAHIAALVARFDYPQPRVEFGIAARGIASAAMDLSDGLVGDLPKLAAASALQAHVAVERLPLSAALRAVASETQARDWALGAGEDFELLLAVAPAQLARLQDVAARLNLRLSIIGELTSGAGVRWTLDGADFAPRGTGFDHFG